MNQNGYWYQYFAVRHNVSFYIAVISIAGALISMLTGKTISRYEGIVSRDQDPETFRQSVVMLWVMGVIFLGLFAFGPT